MFDRAKRPKKNTERAKRSARHMPSSDGEWPCLEAAQLHFRFADAVIVNGVDLQVTPGRIVGVVGPNGAGKSTLVRLLSRVLTPETGRILLNGRDLGAWRSGELARLLTVVPQSPELPPGFTSKEVVLMGRTPFLGWLGRETDRDHSIAREAMTETDTWHLAARRTHQLSGGERQRVVLARALAQNPSILLMDEPTAHLDINHQIDVMSLIRRLVEERCIAALLICHDLNLAARYCDEMILLRAGAVLARGTPAHVLTATHIAEAYGATVMIVRHPTDGTPVVLPSAASGGVSPARRPPPSAAP